MKHVKHTSSVSRNGNEDRQTTESSLPGAAVPDRQLPKALSVVLMTLGAVACAAAGVGGLLIGFRFFTNP